MLIMNGVHVITFAQAKRNHPVPGLHT